MSPHVINLGFWTYGLVIITKIIKLMFYAVFMCLFLSHSTKCKPGSIASEGLSCLADEG